MDQVLKASSPTPGEAKKLNEFKLKLIALCLNDSELIHKGKIHVIYWLKSLRARDAATKLLPPYLTVGGLLRLWVIKSTAPKIFVLPPPELVWVMEYH